MGSERKDEESAGRGNHRDTEITDRQRDDWWNDDYWDGCPFDAETIEYLKRDFAEEDRKDAIRNRAWRLKNIARDIERAGQSDSHDETHPPESAATAPQPTIASHSHEGAMNPLPFVIALPIRFIFALISFTFGGLIGWAGMVLVLLKIIGVIHWEWWLVALPLAYGVIYCLYMTIDGAMYRARIKKVGRYARLTQSIFTEGTD